MSRRLKQVLVILVVIVGAFGAAQLVRPERTNPATDAGRTIEAYVGAGSALAPILDRACNDCHSNKTRWARYTEIAPVSWLLTHGVKAGREALNFSDWAAYTPEQQRLLLDVSCQDASSGKMPGLPFTLLRPEARLSPQDVETICAAARQTGAAARR